MAFCAAVAHRTVIRYRFRIGFGFRNRTTQTTGKIYELFVIEFDKLSSKISRTATSIVPLLRTLAFPANSRKRGWKVIEKLSKHSKGTHSRWFEWFRGLVPISIAKTQLNSSWMLCSTWHVIKYFEWNTLGCCLRNNEIWMNFMCKVKLMEWQWRGIVIYCEWRIFQESSELMSDRVILGHSCST